MNQREIDKAIREIEEIAMKIMANKSSQTCGTEYQKWTYALLQAEKIFRGELVIDPKTHGYWKNYVQQILQS